MRAHYAGRMNFQLLPVVACIAPKIIAVSIAKKSTQKITYKSTQLLAA